MMKINMNIGSINLIKFGLLILNYNIFIVTALTGPSHNKVVVCYLSTWAIYRPGLGSYSIDHFDANLCTNVIYAFSGLDIEKDAIKSLDPYNDLREDYGKGGYEKLASLKNTHPHLKVSLAIGGWNEGSQNYSIMVSDPVRRKRFVQNASEFVRRYNFDGLDLDWEYPALRGGKPSDKENFVLLVKELKEELKKYRLLLTSALGASKVTIDKAYDVKELTKYLDFMHIMCYDYGGSWDRKVSPNAPLSNYGILNVEYTIQYLLSLGADPSKIVMGVPFYGRTFVTHLEGNYGDQSNEMGFSGPYTNENGFLGFNELCIEFKAATWNRTYDYATNQAIAKYRDNTTGLTKVVVYDSTRSIANKMYYAMEKQLAGIMIWSIDTDDFLNDCDKEIDTYKDFGRTPGIKITIPQRVNNNYPLLRTINEAIIIALDEIEQQKQIDEEQKENEIPHGDNIGDKTNDSYKLYKNYYLLIFSIAISIKIMQIIRCD